MAFGLNRAELIGRLGADVTINHLASGGRVANGSAVLELDGFSASRVDVSFTRIRGSGVVFEDMAWEDVPVVDGAFGVSRD